MDWIIILLFVEINGFIGLGLYYYYKLERNKKNVKKIVNNMFTDINFNDFVS